MAKITGNTVIEYAHKLRGQNVFFRYLQNDRYATNFAALNGSEMNENSKGRQWKGRKDEK